MHKQIGFTGPLFLLFQILYLHSSSNVASAGVRRTTATGGGEKINPFSPKGGLIRYWREQVRSKSPEPSFLLSKASPMSAVDTATYAKLAGEDSLAPRLPSFCSSAQLLCFPDLSPSLEKHPSDSNFAVYVNKNFTNYGTGRTGKADSFKNYSNGDNLPTDNFRRYGRDSTSRNEGFHNYGEDGNVVDQNFNSYGVGAVGGSGDFQNYNRRVNVPDLNFGTYSTEGNGQKNSFAEYTQDTNSGKESFASYGRNGNGVPNDFTAYGKSSNVITSDFTGYGEAANSGNQSFKNYGSDGNNPDSHFKSYEEEGNAGTLSFTSYRDQANVGADSFQSYAKKSNSEEVDFANYGQSFNEGTESFSGYGQGAKHQKLGFKIYGVNNNSFTNYADKKHASFTQYAERSSSEAAASTMATGGGKPVNRWVEPGKFFRESMLKTKTVMPMPDIRDKMPNRPFLPRSIASKLPFSTSKLADLKRIFHAGDNSSMEGMIADALRDCERAPSRGESKRCVGSAEDMIDFAISILGRNVVVKTTESVEGSKKDVMIGSVKGINGGDVTKSVSCHQSLYPYLLYYCHSVPKVRVYEADLLDPKTQKKINHGVAICHLDTSSWSPTHGAFLALGRGPGKIEVCHWIFENDATWTRAD